uniref:Dolichyl-diphosphooligosaccharide--protein glycosyltransferase subunit 1 n=1 Tax=Nannospalax galili TaxID=1026970 RepID=A0A8C6QGU3_NANGA
AITCSPKGHKCSRENLTQNLNLTLICCRMNADPETCIFTIKHTPPKINLETVYTHVLQPYPTQITQSEKQFVVFEGNHYFYSPYPTKSQTMQVKLSHIKLENPTHSEDVLDYGPFKDVTAYSQDSFKNNSPFLTITSMTRVTEISHWGNIAVEENVDLKCTGSVPKGPFSHSGISSFHSFKTILPAAAQDVYYWDEIGNVSTSHLFILDDSEEMKIRPQFPLFGRWKPHYIIGYNLPNYEYLYNLGDQYALKMRFVDHVFDEQVIDSLTGKIILLEGAKNIQVDSPYISCAPNELHYTCLDTFGCPVIVAYKKNLVEQHIQDIMVHYTFNKVLMLQEPLLVVAAFYTLFITPIIYVRLDFSITKNPAAEARMKLACVTEQVLSLANKRLGLCLHFDETINRYKQSRDVSTLNSGKKSLETEYKAVTSEIAVLLSKLKMEGSDLEMQKLDSQVKELSAVEARLVAGKLKKDTYIETEKVISGKCQELVTKINHILDAL